MNRLYYLKYLVSFLLAALLFLGPQSSQAQPPTQKLVHVKFKEKSKPSIPSGKSARSGVSSIDKVSDKHKAYSIRRIFPDAGVFEVAHKAHGLHLWYEIELPSNSKIKDAIKDYQETGNFDNVEESRPYSFVDDRTLPLGSDDPSFNQQWHFKNNGQTGGTPGADINLLTAWQKETGSSSVVVAVIDGGIDINHPDLKGALWVNSDEIPDNRIDDDHNGYIDDVHGFGFGDQSSLIRPDDHATHVAGTIGAISNNGIGVSGIAGGDGTSNGVRLMSCASFGNFKIGGFEEAMVYAADNGAVISQNSWGGGSNAIEAAINYFIERAGFDNSAENFSKNIQTGPMAGGIVIFAAGNNNTSDRYYGYPGSYEKVIAVGSTDHNDVKSEFSNFGVWVDIFAPGTNVFSTKRSGYGYFSGTSMACPHVSGVAALIVSNLQRTGLKPSDIWNRLRFSARSIDSVNPYLKGQLGWGRLDASVALKEPDTIAPGAIVDLRVNKTKSTSILLQWTASGENNNEGQAAEYDIRYSTNPIDELNFREATIISSPPIPPISGEQVVFEINNLAPATTYYFAIKSVDLFYNLSTLSNVISGSTLKPAKPELITAQLFQQLFTGGVSNQNILVKNIGEEELLVRAGVPQLQLTPIIPPLGAKGRLFAINSTKNMIEEISPKTGTVIHSIPMPEPSSRTSEGLAFDGVHIYYGRSRTIYKISSITGEVIRTFFLKNATSINGLAWSGRYLYVSKYGADYSYNTYEVDTDTGTILRTLNRYSELAFFGNNNTLLTASYGRLEEWDVNSGNFVKQFQIGGNPKCVAFSTIDNIIFVSDESEPAIKAINPADGSVVYTIPYPITTALAGDEGKLGWLESTERVISIPAGQTGEIPVTFNSAGINSSTLTGSVNVISINSMTNPLKVSVTLTVLSDTDIETAKEINFGTEYVGFPIDTTVIIENRGFADLIVNQILSNNAKVTTSIPSVSLTPGQRANMKIIVAPSGTGTIDAVITLTSNDPDEGVISIPVKALLLEAPKINVAPDSLKMTLMAGASETQTITITNTGESTLYWNVRLSGTDSTKFLESSFLQNLTQQSDSIYKNDLGEITLKSSSPESLTCLVYDPHEETIYARSLSGSHFYTYNLTLDKWTAIGLTPAYFIGQATYLDKKLYFGGSSLNIYSIHSGTWSSVPFPIGGDAISITSDDKFVYVGISKSLYRFDPFAEEWLELAAVPAPLYMSGFGALSFHSGVIYANGTQSFTADGNTLFFKYFIETNSWVRSNSISGELSMGGAIDNSSARYFVLGAPYNLTENRIQMSILDIRNGEWTKLATPFTLGTLSGLVFVGKSGVSGIYFIQGGAGKKFGYYETPSAPNWFTISQYTGSLSSGDSQTISVAVNAQALFGGVYKGNVQVYSSYPRIEKNIPLEVKVYGVAEVTQNKMTENVGGVTLGYSRGTSFVIKNTGTAELVIDSISISNSNFTIGNAFTTDILSSFKLPVGESKSLGVYFKPTEIGPQICTYTFHSNAMGSNPVQFILAGTGVYPAELVVPTDTIKATLLTGGTEKKKFSISNIGGGSTGYLVVSGRDNWIHIDSAGYSLNIGPNQSREFEAVIRATGFQTGRYFSSIHVEDYLDPTIQSYQIPVLLEVTGAPDISIDADSLDYGEQFINVQYDTTIQIMNAGVLPLLISSIDSNNPLFTVSSSAPLNLAPGASGHATIHFNTNVTGAKIGRITFTSNDPDENLFELTVKGIGVIPPKIDLDENEIFFTAYVNESVTEKIDIVNQGGSVLKWKIKTDLQSSQTGSFTKKADIPKKFGYPVKLTAITSDAATGTLYAQYLWYQDLYTYNPLTNSWSDVGGAPARTENALGGAVVLNSKMYCTYTDDRSKVYIYDMILKDWTTKPNILNIASATITTDGSLLYIAGEGKFASYNPKLNTWVGLTTPNFTLDGSGGLSYHDGFIYAHSSNSTDFARYNVITGYWENLVPLPGKAALGSSLDPARMRLYTYSEKYLYEYDITSGVWTVLLIPFFDIGDNGGISYISKSGHEGIYFIQGGFEIGFARYEPKNQLGWLRTSQLMGEVESMESQPIGINCNATYLNPGLYHGTINITTNDPSKLAFDVPVTFSVKNASPTIKVPLLISDTVDRSIPTSKYIVLKNEGKEVLEWNISSQLPAWLTANKISGSVMGLSSDSIEVVFSPGAFTLGGVSDYGVEINSNDPSNPKSTTRLLLTIENHQPFVSKTIPNQALLSNQIKILLFEHFADQDGDPLRFSVSTSDNSIISTTIIGSTLFIKALKSGFLTVTVTAFDIYNSSISFSFEVNTTITGVENNPKEHFLSASPNPFENIVKIHVEGNALGRESIVLYDLTGRTVLNVIHIDNSNSTTEVEINTADLAPGLYMCILLVNNKLVDSIKLLKSDRNN